MIKLINMAKEIITAIEAVGADDNRSNWQHLIATLRFHGASTDNVYQRRGLERIADVLESSRGG